MNQSISFITKKLVFSGKIFLSKIQSLWLILLLVSFVFLKQKSLYVLPWGDEFSALNSDLLNKTWSFFLPWNYHPEYFMGHPLLQPLALYTAFSLFGPSVFIARVVALGFALLCLFSFYKVTDGLFEDKFTSFFSVIFTMFLPLFWFHATLILAHIPLMAFGFGTVYAFTDKKYKTLLLFSLGLATIRESALAFFLPLVLQGLLLPSQRKSLFYMVPSLLLFFSHFFFFFIRTGHWIAHPYVYGVLLHNPNPRFFNFSPFFNRSIQFSKDFFFQFPYFFWCLLLIAFGFFVFSRLQGKNSITTFLKEIKQGHFFSVRIKSNGVKSILEKKFFSLLCICVLFFGFYISYPNYAFRSFFPVFVIFVPFGIFLIIKYISFSRIILMFICASLFLQNIFQNKSDFWTLFGFGVKTPGLQLEKHYHKETLTARSFVSYLESKYGNRVRSLEKWIYMPFPYDRTMGNSLYGYVQNSYNIDHWQFMDKPERYGVVALARKKHLFPYNELVYEYLRESGDFLIQKSFPFSEKFILFIHRDLLTFEQKQTEI